MAGINSSELHKQDSSNVRHCPIRPTLPFVGNQPRLELGQLGHIIKFYGTQAAPEGRLETVAVETVSSVIHKGYSLKNMRQWARGMTLVSGALV
jgi:hypothetical protein